MNIESVEEFFKKNNIEDDDNVYFAKNFYSTISLIRDDDFYKYVVLKGLTKPRNPNKYIYPIKPGKDMLPNIVRRIAGAVGNIREVEKVKNEYRQAMLIQATMLYRMGYEFKDDEITRIMEVYEVLDGERKNINLDLERYDSIYEDIVARKKYPVSSANEYRAKLSEALKTVSDDESSKDIFFDIIEGNEVENQEIIEDLVDLVCYSNVSVNHRANINLRRIDVMEILKSKGIESYEETQNYEEYIESYGDEIANEEQIAEYRSVLGKIYEKSYTDYEKNGKSMAQALYDNLNNELLYNTTAFSWSQNNERVREIINHHESEDINEKSRAVTCHQWSRAYRELLTAAGYEAYIVGDKGHQFVFFFDEDGNPFMADATNPNDLESPNWFHCSDLIRSKLGLTPNNLYKVASKIGVHGDGFNQYFDNGTLKEKSKIIYEQYKRKEDFKFNIDDYRKEDGKIDFKAILKIIDENPSIAEKFAKKIRKNHQGEDLVMFMNDVLKCLTEGHEDDDLLISNCVSNLVYILSRGEDSLLNCIKELTGIVPGYSIGYSLDLYKKTEDRTKMVPTIYVKEKDSVAYYTWDEAKGFVKESKQEIVDKINSGEYHCSRNNDSKGTFETRFFIPGIKSPKKSIKEEEIAIFGEEKQKIKEADNGMFYLDI